MDAALKEIDRLNRQLRQLEMTDLMREWLTTVDGKVWSFKQREFIC